MEAELRKKQGWGCGLFHGILFGGATVHEALYRNIRGQEYRNVTVDRPHGTMIFKLTWYNNTESQ